VDRYRPQVVWFDWWIQHQAFVPYLQTFAAYYYNRGAQWGRGVAINYKHQAFPEGTALYDIERGQLTGIRPLFWQTDTAICTTLGLRRTAHSRRRW
jgi:alpha-L-fucosidase